VLGVVFAGVDVVLVLASRHETQERPRRSSSRRSGSRSWLDAGGAVAELEQALEELRELARGNAALQALAPRAPVAVDLHQMPEDRLPPAVEAAADFVVVESLTTIAKYASAEHASVRVGRDDGYAVVEVRDDGVGGAEPAAGSGLRGMADRPAALDGRLEVHSPPGGGTVIRANIPCAACA
jgi:signal transduction histidine kinase